MLRWEPMNSKWRSEDGNTGKRCGTHKVLVSCGERKVQTLRKFKVGRVVYRQSMLSGARQDRVHMLREVFVLYADIERKQGLNELV